ncbi:MAG: hypothetical protein ABI651_10020 [Verrucomicrobiota bacterium]
MNSPTPRGWASTLINLSFVVGLCLVAAGAHAGNTNTNSLFIAYVVPANTPGNQTGLSTVSVGMDFDVANEIIVTRLGIFDASSDGFSEGTVLTARIWDRSQDPPVQLVSIEFPADNPGELVAGSRFKPLTTPLHLATGFQGTITGDGWTDSDTINNAFGNVANVLWTVNDGNGSILFVGKSRYGSSPGDFPGTVDGGPAARFAAGTFEYQTTPPVLPGKPDVSTVSGDKQVVLSWAAVTVPAPASTYRVGRGGAVAGPFTQITEATNTSYLDTNVVNGTDYYYIVEGITSGGKVGPASDVRGASPFLLATNHAIAYFVPGNKQGNQAIAISVGMDFDVQNPINVTRVGVFDSKSDGLKLPITARIYDRDSQQVLTELTFTPDAPGVLIEGMRFLDVSPPLHLDPGFHGVIAAEGYGPEEPIINSGGDPNAVVWSLNDGNGSIQFVGSSRYTGLITPGSFPETPDGGPEARYAAGTFEFDVSQAQFPGTPKLSVLQPFEDSVVTLYWQTVTNPLPAAKYEIERTGPDNQPGKIGETTDVVFQDTAVKNGSNYCYRVRAVGPGGQIGQYSASVCATPNPIRGGIAYIVPAGLVGNQALNNGAVGMDFDVAHPITVTKLGVFDDASDGLTMTLTAVLFDRVSKRALATQEFTTDNQGDLIDGSRFLPLPQALVLDEGFQGSMVIWYSNDSTERLFNTFGNPDPTVADLKTFDGGSLLFVGASRYGSAGTFPGTVDSGPVNRYAGGTFAFEPTVIQRPIFIAYSVPTNTIGNQDLGGASLGMDFDVGNEIIVTRLGVFDDGSDGLKQTIMARVWDRGSSNGPVQLASVAFTTNSPGQLIGGSRFKPLLKPLHLPRGFKGTISTDGYGALEKINNSQGSAANATWTLNDGSGSIQFVGSSRYGAQGQFPATADGGPAARYAAGTFEYETTPPAVPGQPAVTVHRPFENGVVTLNWLAVTNPLPAAKYEVLRGATNAGPFTKIGETNGVTFQDMAVQNGTTYFYVVHAVAAGGEIGGNSDPVSATPNPPQAGIAYIVPGGLAGNQALNNGAVGMDFDVISPIKVTKLGVFDDSSDGLTMILTAVLYDRSTKQALATQEFNTGNQGDPIGGSRFLPLAQPITLNAGFSGSIVIWYSDSDTEKLFNTFGNPDPDLLVFDGGSILFVGSGRFGTAGQFPNTVDGGPVNRYAGATFTFEPISAVQGPVLQFVRESDKVKLTWTSGVLQSVDRLGDTWKDVPGATSPFEVPFSSGVSKFFRLR